MVSIMVVAFRGVSPSAVRRVTLILTAGGVAVNAVALARELSDSLLRQDNKATRDNFRMNGAALGPSAFEGAFLRAETPPRRLSFAERLAVFRG